MQTSNKRRFISLQAGRFVAALLVVLFHIEGAITKIGGPYPFNDVFAAGHAGVEYFFVLSGFLIYWVHRGDVAVPGTALTFLRKRCVRILPMYWLAFGCLLTGVLLNPEFANGRDLSGPSIFSDVFFLPHPGEMILTVAWTLRREFIFYIVFSSSLFIPRVGLRPFFAWQAAIVICLVSPALREAVQGSAFFNVYNLGFGAGVFIARFLEAKRLSYPIPLFFLGGGCFLSLMIFEWYTAALFPPEWPFVGGSEMVGSIPSVLFYTASAALVVMSIAALEIDLPFRELPILELLGGASYVLYLFHGMISSAFIRIFHWGAPGLGGWTTMLVTMAVTIGASICIHVVVERPILRALSSRKAKTVHAYRSEA
ncbi:hypothetical protein BST63_14285 [Bradyrhizobium canariense]|uniref:Acyltransferase 3 domain-containing protein n=1 Tax=Bradyrhizobium canariense TaxID=255045 RepID=A0ABX3X4S3_9BRAD|nr:acyltransferase [Bradyrhizobium canariense]OSJ14858.1 hypothetical protein BSR47_17595 [Bradyrhizobium canariense]OSJ29588.1 hypothetical protein BST63_14285 [Bradyrhizobium canariense]